MKVRGTIAGTPLSAKLIALCWGALTLLVPVAVSACTSGTTSSTPSIFSPTETGTFTTSAPASDGGTPSDGATSETPTPGVTTTPPPTTSPATPEVTVTQTVTVPPSTIPPSAPVTGGGGTAGFQGTLVLVLGVGAILVGAGSLAYRRWLGRGR